MITSLLEAPKQVRISTPALPPKGKSQALVNVEIARVIDFGITKRGVIYMRYGTATGRGCSFISFEKLLKALLELSEGNAPRLKAYVVTYLRQVPQVFPLLAHWNNEQLSADTWHKANNELAAHLESQANRIAGELKANIAKRQLLEEIQRRGLVAFPVEEDGEWFIKVCTYSKEVLGHALALRNGGIAIVANAPRAKEVAFVYAKGAIEGLMAVRTNCPPSRGEQFARHYCAIK